MACSATIVLYLFSGLRGLVFWLYFLLSCSLWMSSFPPSFGELESVLISVLMVGCSVWNWSGLALLLHFCRYLGFCPVLNQVLLQHIVCMLFGSLHQLLWSFISWIPWLLHSQCHSYSQASLLWQHIAQSSWILGLVFLMFWSHCTLLSLVWPSQEEIRLPFCSHFLCPFQLLILILWYSLVASASVF